MSKYKNKLTVITTLVLLLLIIVIEPSVAEESEIESINWLELMRDFLNIFARILEHAASIVQDGAEKLVELFEETE